MQHPKFSLPQVSPTLPQDLKVLILGENTARPSQLQHCLPHLPMQLDITLAGDLMSFRRQARTRMFDLILIDRALAAGGGIDPIRAYTTDGPNAQSYFVLVSGNDSSDLAIRALRSGYDDFAPRDAITPSVLAHMVAMSAQKRARVASDLMAGWELGMEPAMDRLATFNTGVDMTNFVKAFLEEEYEFDFK